MIPLPSWVPRDLWDEYCTQRKKDKKEMTQRSAIGRLKRLTELRDAGHDPAQCLEEAINGHWLDFYVPREKPIEFKANAATNHALEQIKRDERERKWDTPEAHEARRRAMEALGRRV